MKFCREYGRYSSSVSPVRTSLFERVSYVDVILEGCHLLGLHSWSVSHFGRHYSSFSRIWTPILTRVVWTSLFERVSYVDAILEAFSILDVIFQFFFYIHGYVHRNSILIRSNEMHQYAGIYLLRNHPTCFGCPSHPSSGVHKTVTAACGTGHSIWATSFLQRGL